MGNPYTRFLARRLKESDLNAFLGGWDEMETLVIALFRAGRAEAADEAEYARLRARLGHLYPRWSAALEPYWRAARVAGRPAPADPFAGLLAAEGAADFVNNWRAMQFLPAAREALNQLVLERQEEG
ncbi:MAG: hypothetical protein ACRDHL_02010 [Candidatus Promineifilaceae bacterium]